MVVLRRDEDRWIDLICLFVGDESDECEARFYCVSVEHTFTVSGRDIFLLERSLINSV